MVILLRDIVADSSGKEAYRRFYEVIPDETKEGKNILRIITRRGLTLTTEYYTAAELKQMSIFIKSLGE